MGRTKPVPRKRLSNRRVPVSDKDNGVEEDMMQMLGRQSLPRGLSMEALVAAEVEQARIAQQHRQALRRIDDAKTSLLISQQQQRKFDSKELLVVSTSKKKQRRNCKRKPKSVSFAEEPALFTIIGPPELQIEIIWNSSDDEEKKDQNNDGSSSSTFAAPPDCKELWTLHHHKNAQEAELSIPRSNNNSHLNHFFLVRRFQRSHALLRVVDDDVTGTDTTIQRKQQLLLLVSPQSAVDAIANVMPLLTLDQRRALYYGIQNKFWVVGLEQQQQQLSATMKNKDHVDCTHSNDPILTITIGLTEYGLQTVNRHKKPLSHMAMVLAALFPDQQQLATVMLQPDHNTAPDVMTAQEFYRIVDNRQLLKVMNSTASCATTTTTTPSTHSVAAFGFPITIPGLKPTLRAYQSAAVAWMLRRERVNPRSNNDEWKLAWMVLHIQTGTARSLCEVDEQEKLIDGLFLLHCPFTGWFATSIGMAQAMTVESSQTAAPVRGGILAESMGLGKTVEVLACILSNPFPTEEKNNGGTVNHLVLEGTNMQILTLVDASNVPNSTETSAPFDDDISLKENIRTGPGEAAIAIAVTPERASPSVPEVWMDDDVLGACICGDLICFSKKSRVGEIVVCRACQEAMHHQCAYLNDEESVDQANLQRVKFRQRFSNSTIGGYYCTASFCQSCAPEQTSRATLIVSPIAILDQWEREICRHTRKSDNKPLSVIVYKGIKNLSGDRSKSKFMHARCLRDADIVLVSFEALRTDLTHVAKSCTTIESSMRRKKRYRIVSSPLVSILWWRVCLDEAQRVESTAAGAAKVALCLRSVHRWCITGTPIGRGKLDDIYGLLLFLGVKPFDDIFWFRRCIQRPGPGIEERVGHLFRDLLWRSTKDLESVRTEMNIPDQIEKKILLKFSSVEKHFYDKQLERTLESASFLSEAAQSRRRKADSKAVSSHLHMLRAACCHPQVGSRGISSLRKRARTDGVEARVMTMGQILEKLIDDAKLQCEEAQRVAIMHTNAMGAVARLMVEAKIRGIAVTETDEVLLTRSCTHYLESIRLSEENSVPSLVIGSFHLHGSMGFLENRAAITCGSAKLEWRLHGSKQTEYWAKICFSSERKSLTEIRFRFLGLVPEAVVSETHQDLEWKLAEPTKMELQCAGRSGEFFTIEEYACKGSAPSMDFTRLKQFRTTKSNTWRILLTVSTSIAESECTGIYLGLDVELYEPSIANDQLQRLHCLHNASLSLKALASVKRSEQGNDKTFRIGKLDLNPVDLEQKVIEMGADSSFLENVYLDGARCLHRSAKLRFQNLSDNRREIESMLGLTDCWEATWWHDFLVACRVRGTEEQKHYLYERLVHELDGTIQIGLSLEIGAGIVPFPAFHDISGFLVAMRMRMQNIRTGLGERRRHLKATKTSSTSFDGNYTALSSSSGVFHCPLGSHALCMNRIAGLSENPDSDEMSENSSCRVCKADWNQTGPMCRHCTVGGELADKAPDRVTLLALRCLHGLARGPIGTAVLADTEKKQILDQATSFFAVLEAMDKERTAAWRFWRIHLDLLNDLDELRQCKTAMRLTYENEDLSKLSEDEQNGVVIPCTVHARFHEHSAKQAMALGSLKRCKGTLSYLKGLCETEKKQTIDSDCATCLICLSPFDGNRAVLRCGHSVHVDECLERLRLLSNGRILACPLRCRMQTQPSDIMVASNQLHDDGTQTDKNVEGSFGTKVTRLIGDILEIRQKGERGIVFSQWDDMIDIIGIALMKNNIPYVKASGTTQIGSQVNRFRSTDCTIILMNVKNGGEGLTLLEANHVFMVEPLLNAGMDRQGRNACPLTLIFENNLVMSSDQQDSSNRTAEKDFCLAIHNRRYRRNKN